MYDRINYKSNKRKVDLTNVEKDERKEGRNCNRKHDWKNDRRDD